MATQQQLLTYLEKIVLAGCVDAQTARVHNYHSSLVLDVVLSGAVLYILTRQGKITIKDEESEKSHQENESHSSNANESLSIHSLIQKSKKKFEDNNISVVDSASANTSTADDDENDDIIHEAFELVKSAPEKTIQLWINEFSGRTVKGKYQIKDLKKRPLHGLVNQGLTTHEKHTISSDKFPLTDEGRKQQEELFHIIQEIFNSYEQTLPKGKDKQEHETIIPKLKFSTKDLVFVAFYLMIDNHLMAFPKDQREHIKLGMKSLFSNTVEVHRFLSMAENNTSHLEAEIITSIINLTYSSTTDSLT